jgi:hypothetical protein
MHEAHSADELRKVHMGNIFSDTFIGLDFVEKVAALSQFHCNPSPDIILASLVKANDVIMTRNVSMYGDFEL